MSFFINDEIVLDVFGDFACFTRPEFKVERVSYECINPSAARGILNAIYSKPIEFYYQITKIEIMNPIKTINIKKNEFTEKINTKTLKPSYNVTEAKTTALTQRNNIYLKDVYYRIYAKIKPQVGFEQKTHQLYDQFEKRLKKGKCFYQPSLGLRECMCFFKEIDTEKQPLNLNLDLGIMLYDCFDITKNIILDTSKNGTNSFFPSFFSAKIQNGILDVPNFDDVKVFKMQEVINV